MSTPLCGRCKRVGPVKNCSACIDATKEAKAMKRQPELPKMREYEFHEYANIFPLMDDAELAALAEDIDANGLREPIWKFEWKILDGRNRYLACKLKDVDPRFEEYRGKDALGFVLSKNLHRRHLTTGQRAMIAARLVGTKHGGDHTSEQDGKTHLATRAESAEKLKVSVDSVDAAATVLEHGAAPLVKAVDAGKVPIATAATIADALPKKAQAAAVKSGTVPEVAKIVRTKRKKKAATARTGPAQPSLPKMGKRKPHVEPTKKGRPTESDALYVLEAVEWCEKVLDDVRYKLDELARGPFGKFMADIFLGREPDQTPEFLLYEKKGPDRNQRNDIRDFFVCDPLDSLSTKFFLTGYEIIRLHGADEVIGRCETIEF